MMTLIRNIAITLSVFAFMSCSKFDDINTSPDSSTQVKSSLLATALVIKPLLVTLEFIKSDSLLHDAMNKATHTVALNKTFFILLFN